MELTDPRAGSGAWVPPAFSVSCGRPLIVSSPSPSRPSSDQASRPPPAPSSPPGLAASPCPPALLPRVPAGVTRAQPSRERLIRASLRLRRGRWLGALGPPPLARPPAPALPGVAKATRAGFGPRGLRGATSQLEWPVGRRSEERVSVVRCVVAAEGTRERGRNAGESGKLRGEGAVVRGTRESCGGEGRRGRCGGGQRKGQLRGRSGDGCDCCVRKLP